MTVNFVNELIAKGYAQQVPDDRLEASPGKYGTYRTTVSTTPRNLRRYVSSLTVAPDMKALP